MSLFVRGINKITSFMGFLRDLTYQIRMFNHIFVFIECSCEQIHSIAEICGFSTHLSHSMYVYVEYVCVTSSKRVLKTEKYQPFRVPNSADYKIPRLPFDLSAKL